MNINVFLEKSIYIYSELHNYYLSLRYIRSYLFPFIMLPMLPIEFASILWQNPLLWFGLLQHWLQMFDVPSWLFFFYNYCCPINLSKDNKNKTRQKIDSW